MLEIAFFLIILSRNRKMLVKKLSPTHMKVFCNWHFSKIHKMEIEKALINDRLRVSKVSRKFRIPTIYNFAAFYEFVPAESLKTTTFAESPKLFGRSPWNFLDMGLTSIRNKRKIRRRLLIAQRETVVQSYQSPFIKAQKGA